ncbi:Conserved oligomeric Golgi complex subunit [Lobulomyces angularis]|nr:Conserved oligomeric Golgi complex subunit [Lobulomyces angularis]
MLSQEERAFYESQDYKEFTKESFDPNDYANTQLSLEGNLDISTALSKLSFNIEFLNKLIYKEVSENYELLISTVTDLKEIEIILNLIKENKLLINETFERLKLKIREPTELIQRKIISLERVQLCSEYFRTLIKFFQLLKKLKQEWGKDIEENLNQEKLVEITGSGGSGNIKNGFKNKEILKAAQTLADIEFILSKNNLNGIKSVDSETQYITNTRNEILMESEVIFQQGLLTQNQMDIYESLCILFSLKELSNKCRQIITSVVSDITENLKFTFDIISINKEISTATVNSSSTGGVKRVNDSANSNQLFQKYFWSRMEKFFDSIFNNASQVYVLERVLERNFDTTKLFAELNMANDSSLTKQFWNNFSQVFDQELKASVKGSQLLQQILQNGYAKMLRMVKELFGRLEMANAEKNLELQDINKEIPPQTAMLKPLASFELVYIKNSLQRLLEPVNLAFPKDRVGGKGSIPTRDEVDKITRVISSELEVAKFDAILLKKISQNVVKALTTFSVKAENMISTDSSAYQFTGLATASNSQLCNIELINSLWRLKENIWKILDEDYQNNVNQDILKNSVVLIELIGNSLAAIDEVLQSVVEPMFFQMAKEFESTLLKIHKEDFSKPKSTKLAQEATITSPYCFEFSTKLRWCQREILAKLQCGDESKDWIKILATKLIHFYFRNISFVLPLNEAGKLKLGNDLTKVEFTLDELLTQHGIKFAQDDELSDLYKAFKSFKPLLFMELNILSEEFLTAKQKQELNLPPIIVLQNMFTKSYPKLLPPLKSRFNSNVEEMNDYFDKNLSTVKISNILTLYVNSLESYSNDIKSKGEKEFCPEFILIRNCVQKLKQAIETGFIGEVIKFYKAIFSEMEVPAPTSYFFDTIDNQDIALNESLHSGRVLSTTSTFLDIPLKRNSLIPPNLASNKEKFNILTKSITSKITNSIININNNQENSGTQNNQNVTDINSKGEYYLDFKKILSPLILNKEDSDLGAKFGLESEKGKKYNNSNNINYPTDEQWYQLNQLRIHAGAPERSEEGIERLLNYYAQLIKIEKVFPFDTFQVETSFTWQDSLFPEKKVTCNCIQYEKASVLYNAASIYSSMGKIQQFRTIDGKKKSAMYFQKSANLLLYCRDSLIQRFKVKFVHNDHRDLSENTLTALAEVMYGQAVECYFEKANEDKSSSLIISMISIQTADHYETALQIALGVINSSTSSFQNKEKLPKNWMTTLKAKSSLFNSIAHYHCPGSMTADKALGERISRLTLAKSFCTKSLSFSLSISLQQICQAYFDLISNALSICQTANFEKHHQTEIDCRLLQPPRHPQQSILQFCSTDNLLGDLNRFENIFVRVKGKELNEFSISYIQEELKRILQEFQKMFEMGQNELKSLFFLMESENILNSSYVANASLKENAGKTREEMAEEIKNYRLDIHKKSLELIAQIEELKRNEEILSNEKIFKIFDDVSKETGENLTQCNELINLVESKILDTKEKKFKTVQNCKSLVKNFNLSLIECYQTIKDLKVSFNKVNESLILCWTEEQLRDILPSVDVSYTFVNDQDLEMEVQKIMQEREFIYHKLDELKRKLSVHLNEFGKSNSTSVLVDMSSSEELKKLLDQKKSQLDYNEDTISLIKKEKIMLIQKLEEVKKAEKNQQLKKIKDQEYQKIIQLFTCNAKDYEKFRSDIQFFLKKAVQLHEDSSSFLRYCKTLDKNECDFNASIDDEKESEPVSAEGESVSEFDPLVARFTQFKSSGFYKDKPKTDNSETLTTKETIEYLIETKILKPEELDCMLRENSHVVNEETVSNILYKEKKYKEIIEQQIKMDLAYYEQNEQFNNINDSFLQNLNFLSTSQIGKNQLQSNESSVTNNCMTNAEISNSISELPNTKISPPKRKPVSKPINMKIPISTQNRTLSENIALGADKWKGIVKMVSSAFQKSPTISRNTSYSSCVEGNGVNDAAVQTALHFQQSFNQNLQTKNEEDNLKKSSSTVCQRNSSITIDVDGDSNNNSDFLINNIKLQQLQQQQLDLQQKKEELQKKQLKYQQKKLQDSINGFFKVREKQEKLRESNAKIRELEKFKAYQSQKLAQSNHENKRRGKELENQSKFKPLTEWVSEQTVRSEEKIRETPSASNSQDFQPTKPNKQRVVKNSSSKNNYTIKSTTNLNNFMKTEDKIKERKNFVKSSYPGINIIFENEESKKPTSGGIDSNSDYRGIYEKYCRENNNQHVHIHFSQTKVDDTNNEVIGDILEQNYNSSYSTRKPVNYNANITREKNIESQFRNILERGDSGLGSEKKKSFAKSGNYSAEVISVREVMAKMKFENDRLVNEMNSNPSSIAGDNHSDKNSVIKRK